MKKVLIAFPGHGNGRLFDPRARDNCCQPYIYLRRRLRELNYDFQTADNTNLLDCERLIFWDAVGFACSPTHPRGVRSLVQHLFQGQQWHVKTPALYATAVQAGLRQSLALITGEPPLILPSNWERRIHDLFPVVFTWNDAYVDGTRYLKFRWPQTADFPLPPAVPFAKRKLLVNISGNHSSTHPKELYSARRRVIRCFERHHPDQFDLYGTGWDQLGPDGPYPSYRGRVKHKWDVFPKYRFGLCYENMRDEPGWITEKIFDCMRAGAVPVYWGAPNVADFVAKDAFIDRRRFTSDEEMARFLLAVTEAEYRRHREAIEAYLRSPQFASFLPPAFADTVIRGLSL